MRTRNKIALDLIGLAVAALVAWSLRPQPVAVEVAEVVRGPFEQTVVDDGKTRVRDRFVVSAPLAGRVARIGAAEAQAARARAALVRYRSGEPTARWEVTFPVNGSVLKVVQKSEGAVALGTPPLDAVVRLVEPAAFTKVSALGVEEQRVNAILDFAGPLDQVWTIGDGCRVEAMVEDGLQPGDRVIVYPSDAQRDSAKIEIVAGGR